jgi:hypothetical protein
MEHLLSPCTRLFDIWEDQNANAEGDMLILDDRDAFYNNVAHLMESFEDVKELNLDVSTEELLSAERTFTYADLYEMIEDGRTVVWLTPHTAVVQVKWEGSYAWDLMDESLCFSFIVDGKVISAFARSREHLLEICDVVLRLVAASVAHSVILGKFRYRDGALMSATSLEYLMEQCQSLIHLSLHRVDINENHCRVLGTYSRPDLQIELYQCQLRGAAAETLARVLGRNQGPTELDRCDIDKSVLANGLRGNSRLKRMRLCAFDHDAANQDLLAISSALKENKGLLHLHLEYDFGKSDETWGAICDSLETHPTLEVLKLRTFYANGPSFTSSVISSRLQALVGMLKVNTLIHTIHLNERYSQHELFRGSVIPHLQTNRLRSRLLTIQGTRPIAYRAKVLGRALLAVRTDPNRSWILLSGNPEVFFPSTSATTTPAINLPTPATATAISTANVAAVAAYVMPTLTTSTTGSLPVTAATSTTTPFTASASDPSASTAAASVAVSSTGQKRKSRP